MKDLVMENVQNSELFKTYIQSNSLKHLFHGTLWAEGPCYIPHKKILIWSDIPNNRIMKFDNGRVSEFISPSNYSNGNTLDNNEM